jgi:hypothetical protein
MAITSTFRVEATIKAGQVPTIYNVSVPLANTEVSQALSANTVQILIKVRGRANLQLAFTSTESATNYITISPGAARVIDGIDFTGTLYFQTDKPGQTVEIEQWV